MMFCKLRIMNLFFIFGCLFICFNISNTYAQNYFIDDFNDASSPNARNGAYSVWANAPLNQDIPPEYIDTGAFGRDGYSLKFAYNTATVYNLWINLKSDGSAMDITGYDYLSFWVKGKDGDEPFEIQLQNVASVSDQVQIQMFLPGGRVTRDWQKVIIPLKSFNGGGFDRTTVKLIHFLGGTLGWTNTAGTIYIDDLLLGTGIGTHYIDTMEFDEEKEFGWPDLTSYSRAIETGFNNQGKCYKTNTLNTDNEAYRGKASLKLLQSRPSTLSGDGYCNWSLHDASGLDISVINKLVFAVKSDKNKILGQGPRIYIDDSGYDDWLPMKAVTTNWSIHEYNISDFPGLDLLDIRRVRFHTTGETALTNIVWIDEIRFVDSTVPVTVPFNLKINGKTLKDNYVLKATNTFTVEADSETSDKSIEGVAIEYRYRGDNNWKIARTDYNTSLTKTVYTNIWITDNLATNTAWYLRAVAMDSSGNKSYSGSATVLNKPYGIKIEWSHNPFSPNGDGRWDTSILKFVLPEKQEAIRVSIYNINGDLVKELPKAEDTELYNFPWDGKDFNEQIVPVGPYIYQVRYGENVYNGVIVVAK